MKGPLTPVAAVYYSVFWFLTKKDAVGGLSMNSPLQQDLMSLQLVFIGLSLYGIAALHTLTRPPHTHTPTSSPLLSEYDPQTLTIVPLIFLGLSVSPRVSDHCQPIWLTTEETTEQDSLLAASFYTTSRLGQWLQERVDGQDMAPRIQIPPFISHLCCYN